MNNLMSKRSVICFVLVLCLFLTCFVRLVLIATEPMIAQAAWENGTLRVNVSRLRGNIFDCNGNLLTSTKNKTVAVVAPSEQTIMYLSSVLSGQTKKNAIEALKKGKPAVLETQSELYCSGIINLTVSDRRSTYDFCTHLLGYTDSTGHGASGLEKALDDYLYTDRFVSIRYEKDALGRVLSGQEPQIVSNSEINTCGIMTTIDKDIQQAVYNAAKDIPTGAVIVSEASSGKIRAMVSLPDYDIKNLSDYLNAPDSPLLNRCLNSYNVGSVFKPLVAAAALESGYSNNYSYNCTGSLTVDGYTFYCHNKAGHGILNMSQALSESCNTYFYNLALELGAQKVYETATLFGFGINKTLFDSFTTNNENVTSLETLNSSDSALANLAIGQGELLASPVTLLSLYQSIALNGIYYTPSIIEGIVENSKLIKRFETTSPTKAINETTAQILKSALVSTVESGTGQKAKPIYVSAAGKTATAQTGIKDENGEYCEHSWFCGFFPKDSPKYVVCVFIENASKSNITGAEIFKKIADSISAFKGIKG